MRSTRVPRGRQAGRPALAACLATCLAMGLAAGLAAGLAGCTPVVGGAIAPPGPSVAEAPAVATLEDDGFAAVNAARRSHGRRPLAADPSLSDIARRHAEDMLARGYFDHVTPEGRDPGDRVPPDLQHALVWVAENLWRGRFPDLPDARATARRMVDDWLASPEHREAMLREGATEMGLGMARDGHTVIGVLLLARGR